MKVGYFISAACIPVLAFLVVAQGASVGPITFSTNAAGAGLSGTILTLNNSSG